MPVFAGNLRMPFVRSGGALVFINPCRNVVTGRKAFVAPLKSR